eukprot:3970359-Pyramimonas_sp.AAC.1
MRNRRAGLLPTASQSPSPNSHLSMMGWMRALNASSVKFSAAVPTMMLVSVGRSHSIRFS